MDAPKAAGELFEVVDAAGDDDEVVPVTREALRDACPMPEEAPVTSAVACTGGEGCPVERRHHLRA